MRITFFFLLCTCWFFSSDTAFSLVENEKIALAILHNFFNQQRLGHDGNDIQNLKIVYSIEVIKNETSALSENELYLKSPSQKIVTYSTSIEQSNAILILNRKQWLYRKGLRRPIRVSRSHAIADNIDLSDILGIYYITEYNINNAEIIDDVIIIDMEARDPQYRYRHVEIIASLVTQDISRIIYKSINKQEVRNAEISYIQIGDRRLPKYRISPAAVSLERAITALEFTKVSDEELPASFFAPNAEALSQLLDFVQ